MDTEPLLCVRQAVVADARQIGCVHVTSWRETYGGLVSAEYLAALDPVRAGARITATIADPDVISLVAEVSGSIVGFAIAGALRAGTLTEAAPPAGTPHCSVEQGASEAVPDTCTGELYSLYLLQKYHGLGIGKALFSHAAAALTGQGHRAMLVWTLRGNLAQGFYSRMGGVELLTGSHRIGASELPTVGYLFDNLISRD